MDFWVVGEREGTQDDGVTYVNISIPVPKPFKLQTFGFQLIRTSVQMKTRHRIYELEH